MESWPTEWINKQQIPLLGQLLGPRVFCLPASLALASHSLIASTLNLGHLSKSRMHCPRDIYILVEFIPSRRGPLNSPSPKHLTIVSPVLMQEILEMVSMFGGVQ